MTEPTTTEIDPVDADIARRQKLMDDAVAELTRDWPKPPEDSDADRWPPDRLEALGVAPPVRRAEPDATFASLEKLRADERWPRRVGVPAKRPLWTVA